MSMDYQEASIAHGWAEGELDYARDASIIYQEFDVGVVILNEVNNCYVMTAFSTDNMHSLSMWRLIRNILTKYRDKPLLTSYTTNRQKLLKASERYNYILGEGDIVIFPQQQ